MDKHLQILAADPPKWTDVGMFWATVATAIIAAIAAGFAGLAFYLQNQQVQKQKEQIKELERREQLSDRILRYQAYLNAWAVVEGIDVRLFGADTEIHVQLKNESLNAVRDLQVEVLLDGTPLKLTGEQELLRYDSGWTNQGGPQLPSPQIPALAVGEGRLWDWQSDSATSIDAVTVRLQLTDMVGGQWIFDETGAGQLLED